ncbi:MAG: prolyl-tRNA synthetase associated domain-containing protein, partial [Clostridia bacterium]|nr:prolyl-tRNA synthetase associated domain-containing protein [Clostridia bacterium]
GVLSLLFDKEDRVKLLIDRDLLEAEYIGCHPGINTASVSLVVCDLIEKILPTLGKEPTYVTLTAE